MSQKKFIQFLEKEKYDYTIVDDKIVITYKGDVFLNNYLSIIPPGIIFNNEGRVYFTRFSFETWPVEFSSGVQFNNGSAVDLRSLKKLPPDVEFNNKGSVNLSSVKELSSSTQFNNKGDIFLGNVETLPSDIQFNNDGTIYLNFLETIHPNIQLNNKGSVFIENLDTNHWKGNIKGINGKRLFNIMIKQGVFNT